MKNNLIKLPRARTENILEQNLRDETLIYDLAIDKAFNLNATSTIVYKACDGVTTFDDLKRRHKYTDDFIYFALDELKRNNLLKDEYSSPFAATNRREVIKKVGLASMFVLPIITGLIAPKATNAASGGSGGSGEPQAGVTGGRCFNDGTCLGEYSCYGSPNICCFGISTGSPFLLPGRSSSGVEDRTPFVYGSEASAPAPADCSEYFRCCYGQMPDGVCTYRRATPSEEENPEGVTTYFQTCNCSCPNV